MADRCIIVARRRIGGSELGDHRCLAVADQGSDQEGKDGAGAGCLEDRTAADEHGNARRKHGQGEDDDSKARQGSGEFRSVVPKRLRAPILAHQIAVAANVASPTKGLVARSWPKVDIGPWPGTKAVSSPIGHRRVVMDWISCCWSPWGKSQRPTE